MIDAVAFDIGKVLLDFDYSIFVKKMAKRSRCNEVDLNVYLNQSPLLAEYESGFLSSFEFYELSNNYMSWVQLGGDIDGEALHDQSGWSVALSSDGTRIAIGGVNNDGHVRVYDIVKL